MKEYPHLNKTTIFLALFFTIGGNGCNGNPDGSAPPGAFNYRSYDSSGVPIVSGWFTLVNSDSSHVTGEWHLKATGSGERIGPQTGTGKLVGGINGEKFWIELNPQVRNNNLQLNGVFSRDSLAGQWTWINNEGIVNQGRFYAVRKSDQRL